MKNIFSKLFIVASIFLVSCTNTVEPIEPIIIEGTSISQFSFLKTNNPVLLNDIHLDIEGKNIVGRFVQNVEVKNLVATFEHDGLEVTINNIKQTSGVTFNNFTNLVTYTVKTTDGREDNYVVNLTKFTGLPIIYLKTDGEVAIDSKDDYREGDIIIDGGRNYSDLMETSMKIRGRGNSTWYVHPKKPYQLKFSNKIEMLDMPEDKTWLFLAEYSDKTVIRNTIAFELGYLSKLDWTPKSAFSEVYLNNQYNGTYNITQKVEESNNRVAIGDTGYLLEIDQLDRLDPDDVYFYTGSFLINIKEPSLVNGSAEYNYVKDLLNEFETVLNGNQFKDLNIGYAKYIDIDSFIDWYLISEITKNQDSKSFSSIFLNVTPGEKIKMGPLWDFDLAFGNVDYSECEYPEGFWVKDHKWYARLFQDPVFVSKVKDRFLYFRNNQNFILDKMDSYANYLKWAQQENDDKWNTIDVYVWPNPVVFGSYEAEVTHLKDWYTRRMNWLDTAYKNL